MLDICKLCSFFKNGSCTNITRAERVGECLLFDDDYDGFGSSMAGLTDW